MFKQENNNTSIFSVQMDFFFNFQKSEFGRFEKQDIKLFWS